MSIGSVVEQVQYNAKRTLLVQRHIKDVVDIKCWQKQRHGHMLRYACNPCRRKHQSCDHKLPCTRCLNSKTPTVCQYPVRRENIPERSISNFAGKQEPSISPNTIQIYGLKEQRQKRGRKRKSRVVDHENLLYNQERRNRKDDLNIINHIQPSSYYRNLMTPEIHNRNVDNENLFMDSSLKRNGIMSTGDVYSLIDTFYTLDT